MPAMLEGHQEGPCGLPSWISVWSGIRKQYGKGQKDDRGPECLGPQRPLYGLCILDISESKAKRFFNGLYMGYWRQNEVKDNFKNFDLSS